MGAEGLVRRSVQASAVALGAAIVLLPSPVSRHHAPYAAPPPPIPRPIEPLAAQVLERMPSLEVEEASDLARVVRTESESAGLDPVLVMAVIGVESGWELYVAGNGGIKTEVAQFLVKVKTPAEVLEHAGAFLQLYREEGWYLERTVHYVHRVGIPWRR